MPEGALGRPLLFPALVLAALAVPPAAAAPEAPADSVFRALEPGLAIAELPMPVPGDNGDSRLVALRVDLERFDLLAYDPDGEFTEIDEDDEK